MRCVRALLGSEGGTCRAEDEEDEVSVVDMVEDLEKRGRWESVLSREVARGRRVGMVERVGCPWVGEEVVWSVVGC